MKKEGPDKHRLAGIVYPSASLVLSCSGGWWQHARQGLAVLVEEWARKGERICAIECLKPGHIYCLENAEQAQRALPGMPLLVLELGLERAKTEEKQR